MGTHYRKQMREHEERKERERLGLYGPLPKTEAEKIAEIRAELDGLASRLRADLLADLRAIVACGDNLEIAALQSKATQSPAEFSDPRSAQLETKQMEVHNVEH